MTMKHAPKGWNSWDCYGASVTEEEVWLIFNGMNPKQTHLLIINLQN